MNKLIEIIESFRLDHHRYVDEDYWYSCPEHPDYCGKNTKCDCNFYTNNAKVDEALRIIENWSQKE